MSAGGPRHGAQLSDESDCEYIFAHSYFGLCFQRGGLLSVREPEDKAAKMYRAVRTNNSVWPNNALT